MRDDTTAWGDVQADLARLEQKQIFFVGGAPRSGTTWLQQMLDSHPEVSCQGEGLFQTWLHGPLEQMMAARGRQIAEKNAQLFRHSGGYPLPQAEDSDVLTRTAILLALRRQAGSDSCRAIGEKTPENVFFFPKLKALFPQAKLIVIARDPRDALASAWHLFQRPGSHPDEAAAQQAFVTRAIPAFASGMQAIFANAQTYPADCAIVTYEDFQTHPQRTLAGAYRFLGVSDAPEIVDAALAETAFATLTKGRAAGAEEGAFLRKGIVGDWRNTFAPEIGQLIRRELEGVFAHFGWAD